MPGITINVDLSRNNVPRVIAALSGEGDRMTQEMCEHIRDGAQGHAPVRTGNLKSKIRVEGGGSSRNVVSDTSGAGTREYAAYNEFGTRYMAAQPYMLPGFVQGMTHLPAVLSAAARRIESAAGG